MQAAVAADWGAKLDADPKAKLLRSIDAVEVLRFEGDTAKYLATGRLEIDGEGVHLALGSTRAWSVPTAELSATTVELRRRLQLVQKGGALFEFRIPRESVLKFKAAGDLLIAREAEEQRIAKAAAKAAG